MDELLYKTLCRRSAILVVTLSLAGAAVGGLLGLILAYAAPDFGRMAFDLDRRGEISLVQLSIGSGIWDGVWVGLLTGILLVWRLTANRDPNVPDYPVKRMGCGVAAVAVVQGLVVLYLMLSSAVGDSGHSVRGYWQGGKFLMHNVGQRDSLVTHLRCEQLNAELKHPIFLLSHVNEVAVDPKTLTWVDWDGATQPPPKPDEKITVVYFNTTSH